jgi:hypothetical protein
VRQEKKPPGFFDLLNPVRNETREKAIRTLRVGKGRRFPAENLLLLYLLMKVSDSSDPNRERTLQL